MQSVAHSLVAVLLCTASAASAVRVVANSTLGSDPQTVNRLNGESFQQDALVTFNGYQYAAFWTTDAANASVRHPSLSRQTLSASVNASDPTWETFTFTDYNQTEDDGHDIISLGVAPSDGTVHLSFDHHDNVLKYRASKARTATDPASTPWSADLFGATLDYLPGTESLNKTTYFGSVTYPRFLRSSSSASASFLFELRIGRSGLGDDWLYEYDGGGNWTLVGKYLEGVNNNAYINGLDFDHKGNLVTTWTYRDYVNDTGKNVAVQAGPNGPENNHDMDFATSPDLGRTWLNTWGQPIANTTAGRPILPGSAGITVFSIPKYGGILNQEAQTVDEEGRVHVLNRENTTGTEQWYHYWRSTTSHWTRTPLPLTLSSANASQALLNPNITRTPTVIGKRGKLAALSTSLFALLPSNAPNSTALSVLRSTAAGHFRNWQVVWEAASGSRAEVLYDRYRLAADGVLSLFLVDGVELRVVDLELEL
ncbi:lignin expressed protein lep1 [Heterobasidion irregulare TC 32-1]|uniref:Lignin expressed protein lep1 n=1 Tax=Heterobasidion irregulare (strain TC 32-1) TaxID=747525 RepID=W4JTH6_HETIT|nr:lignin expressed protein lep1 [Heterobasidion irregulare TC 32-1]ETW76405.1 lignin expressed protein lep1 [Heterobasidion irregulare TC 32-1]